MYYVIIPRKPLYRRVSKDMLFTVADGRPFALLRAPVSASCPPSDGTGDDMDRCVGYPRAGYAGRGGI